MTLRCDLEVLCSPWLQHGLLRRCSLKVLRSLIRQHGLVLRCCMAVLRSLMLQHGLMLRCGLEVLRSPMLQHGPIRRGLEANATVQHNAAYWSSTTSRHNATARPDTAFGLLPRLAS